MCSKHPENFDERERRLIEELYPSLRRVASTVRPPGQDGNDLVQEAFLRTIWCVLGLLETVSIGFQSTVCRSFRHGRRPRIRLVGCC
jgi:hypothetical protein